MQLISSLKNKKSSGDDGTPIKINVLYCIPISLLPNISKIFEKAINTKLINFLVKYSNSE